MKCKICNEEVLANNHYWRSHKIPEAEYYVKYVPRFSKQTGEPIRFKNRDFYLTSDFNDKREMAAWFKENPVEAKEYAINLLKTRKEGGKITYAPSQVELRSIMSPSLKWFYKNFKSYNELCSSLGLETRFDKEGEEIRYSNLKDHAVVIIDSREQNPLKFKDISIEVVGLPYGDYALKPNRLKVHVERKSISDFAGSFGANYERFEREVKRAKKDRAYLVVLVECSLSDALAFNYLPHMKYSKVSPDYCFHNIRHLMQNYQNVQFLFVNGRKKASETVLKIFSMTHHPKHFDLQYLYDLNLL